MLNWVGEVDLHVEESVAITIDNADTKSVSMRDTGKFSCVLVAIALGIVNEHIQAASIKDMVELLDSSLRPRTRDAGAHHRLGRLVGQGRHIESPHRATKGAHSNARAVAAGSKRSERGRVASCLSHRDEGSRQRWEIVLRGN